MKKVTDDEMREEYDFSGAVRGKYAGRRAGATSILIDRDLADIFRDSETVNFALRQYLADHGAPPNRRN